MTLRRLPLAFAFLSGFAVWGAEVSVGNPVPSIEAKLLDGTKISIGAGADKVAIVNFWATWCAPCRAEMPAIQTYYDRHKSQGLQVIGFSMDDPRDLARVREVAQSFSFPIALKADADFKGLGRIWRMPSTFVIDRSGVLRKNGHEGQPTVDLEALESLVTPLLERP